MSDKEIDKLDTARVNHGNSEILIKDIRALIDKARNHFASEYNSTQPRVSRNN